jgi:hypothetical protein
VTVNRRLLALAGLLALLALGLPWERIPDIPGAEFSGATVPGTDHPMRLTGALAAALLWWAIRRDSRTLAWLAIGVGALALPIGVQLTVLQSGRFCYLAALVCAAIGAGLIRPRRPSAARPGWT